MKQYVQHISGTGRVFRVLDDSGFCWKVNLSSLECDCWLPKSEYRLCEPPQEWEDVTDEYTVICGRMIAHNGEKYQCIRPSDRIRMINHLHNGPCFIIERKKS